MPGLHKIPDQTERNRLKEIGLRARKTDVGYVVTIGVILTVNGDIFLQQADRNSNNFSWTYGTGLLLTSSMRRLSGKNIKCPNVSLSQKPLPLTVLVSFPGSGNTWTRHLLEQMTGIATGSDFFDKKLEAGGFIGEKKMDTSTIAVKTHDLYKPLSGKPLRGIKRAILIIRNPYKAMVADFNREQSKNHVGTVSLPYFIKGWKRYLAGWTNRWLQLNHNWITLMDNLHVIFYENLVSHLERELTRLYSFLDDGSIHGNVQCALRNTEGNFHRNRSKELPISFFYNEDDVRLVNSHIDKVSILLKKYNHSFFDISSYKL
ncbi:WSCD family member GA21586-like [Haliotis asinina]|uniref:WSCD family member GA21586-like n=1 Tax=Haliotis asinina TaxID=109174 RepID=UPI003531CD61